MNTSILDVVAAYIQKNSGGAGWTLMIDVAPRKKTLGEGIFAKNIAARVGLFKKDYPELWSELVAIAPKDAAGNIIATERPKGGETEAEMASINNWEAANNFLPKESKFAILGRLFQKASPSSVGKRLVRKDKPTEEITKVTFVAPGEYPVDVNTGEISKEPVDDSPLPSAIFSELIARGVKKGWWIATDLKTAVF